MLTSIVQWLNVAERGLIEYCVIVYMYALQWLIMAYYSDLLKAVYIYQNSNTNG